MKIPIISGLMRETHPIMVRIREQRSGADRLVFDRARIVTQGRRIYVFELKRRKELVTASYDVITLDENGRNHLELYSPAPGIYYPINQISTTTVTLRLTKEEALNFGFGDFEVLTEIRHKDLTDDEKDKLNPELKKKLKKGQNVEDLVLRIKRKIKDLPDGTIVTLELPTAKAVPKISEEAKISYMESLKRKAELYKRQDWLEKWGPQLFFILAMGILMIVSIKWSSALKGLGPSIKELAEALNNNGDALKRLVAEVTTGGKLTGAPPG